MVVYQKEGEKIMGKKINCRHELDKKQEIQARRLRVKLDNKDPETLHQYYLLWLNWLEISGISFKEFLKQKDVVYYSAYIRSCKLHGERNVLLQIWEIKEKQE